MLLAEMEQWPPSENVMEKTISTITQRHRPSEKWYN